MPSPKSPLKMYRKHAVKAGVYHQTYIDPNTEDVHRETVYISPQYLRQSAWNTMQMMKRNLDVPVCLDHQEDAYPKKTGEWLRDEMKTAVGLMRGVKYDPKREELEYEYEIQDPAIASKIDQGIIKKVSPNFHASFSPGDGTVWNNVIGHLALTFRPKDYRQGSEPMVATVNVPAAKGQQRFSVLSVAQDSIIKLVPMYKLPFGVLASMAKKTSSGIEFNSADYNFKFKGRPEFIAWLNKRYRHTLKMSVAGKQGHILYFAVIHAPVGGVHVNGRHYPGGQFIPNSHVESLPTAERDKIRAGSAEMLKKRAATAGKYINADETHKAAIARHAGEHAKAEMSPEDKKAAMKRWSSLRGYHGENALQQVAALAGKESAQLAKLDPNSDKAKHIQRRLRAYHEMGQIAKAPAAAPMKAAASQSAPATEAWDAKNNSVTMNGKEVAKYDFDRDSDSFWVDNRDGAGQKSFNTKKEMLDYIKQGQSAPDNSHSNAMSEMADAAGDVKAAEQTAKEKTALHKVMTAKEFKDLPPHKQEEVSEMAKAIDGNKEMGNMEHDLAMKDIADTIHDAYDYGGTTTAEDDKEQEPTDWVKEFEGKSHKQIRDDHRAQTKSLKPVEPWQMTAQEYVYNKGLHTDYKMRDFTKEQRRRFRDESKGAGSLAHRLHILEGGSPMQESNWGHRSAVKGAVQSGKKVPQAVLDDYPELNPDKPLDVPDSMIKDSPDKPAVSRKKAPEESNKAAVDDMASKIAAHVSKGFKSGIHQHLPIGFQSQYGDLSDNDKKELVSKLHMHGMLSNDLKRKKNPPLGMDIMNDLIFRAKAAENSHTADPLNRHVAKTESSYFKNVESLARGDNNGKSEDDRIRESAAKGPSLPQAAPNAGKLKKEIESIQEKMYQISKTGKGSSMNKRINQHQANLDVKRAQLKALETGQEKMDQPIDTKVDPYDDEAGKLSHDNIEKARSAKTKEELPPGWIHDETKLSRGTVAHNRPNGSVVVGDQFMNREPGISRDSILYHELGHSIPAFHPDHSKETFSKLEPLKKSGTGVNAKYQHNSSPSPLPEEITSDAYAEAMTLDKDRERKGLPPERFNESPTNHEGKFEDHILNLAHKKGLPVPRWFKPAESGNAQLASRDANSEPTPHGKENPWHGKRPEVMAEMRRLHDELTQHEKTNQSMQPPQGTVGIGGADFDSLNKREVAGAYLSALNKGQHPDEAHKAALEAGKASVKNWNERTSKGRVSASGAYQNKRWEGMGDDYADTIHRRFVGLNKPQDTKPAAEPVNEKPVKPSSFTTEEDSEGNIRGVVNTPKETHGDIYGHYPPMDQIKGKWVEKKFHDQDGDEALHSKLKRDVVIAHGQHLNRSGGNAGSADLAKGMASYITDRKNALAKHMNPTPEGRPDVVAEYPESSGLTRKYRIEPVNNGGHDTGAGYKVKYDRHDPETGEKLGSSHDHSSVEYPSYNEAAMEIGGHLHSLVKNGNSTPVIHDKTAKEHFEGAAKRFKEGKREDEESFQKEKAESQKKYHADLEAVTNLRNEVKSTKHPRHSIDIDFESGKKVKATGVRHGHFLIHRPAELQQKGIKGAGFTVTHIPSGMAAYRNNGSQQDALEVAHLLSSHGDWSKKKMDNETLTHGAQMLRHHKAGDYAKAAEMIGKAKKDKPTGNAAIGFGVVHAPVGGADAQGHHYAGGQFTPNDTHGGGQRPAKKAEAPAAQQKRAFYTKADGHARNLNLKPVIAQVPGMGQVRQAYQHGNLLIHPAKGKGKWQVTHAPTGKRVGSSTYKNDAIRKAYLLHHGLDWNFMGNADPVHKARFEDVAKGVIPRGLDEGTLEPGGSVSGDHSDQSKRLESWMKHAPNYSQARDKYIATHGSMDENGQLKSISANIDDWRDFIPGYNGINAPETHAAAKYANERFLDELLTTMKDKGNKKVAILGGGGGSGKGTAVASHFDERDYPIRLDQTSSDYDSLMQRVNKIKEHGMEPDLVFIDRKPKDAWQGVVGRSAHLMDQGKKPRVVPKHVAIQANIDARKVALRIAKEHHDIPLRVIDNHGGYNNSRLLKDRGDIVRHLEGQDYNINDELKEADNHVNELEKQGKLPAHVAAGLRGK